MRVEAVLARIADRVPALAGRIEGAARFSDYVAESQMPQMTPAAFVLPGALRGGQVNSATGMFIQGVTETVIVVLALRGKGAARDDRIVAEFATLIEAVIAAVCGWGPGDGIGGEFQLGQAELVGEQGGCFVYQIDFIVADQLRISA